MNKIAIAVVALPLVCMGAGYATGLTIAPDSTDTSSASSETGESAEKAAGQQKTKEHDKDHAAKADAPTKDKAYGQDHDPEHTDHYADPDAPPKDKETLRLDPSVLRLGQMTVPVEKPQSVTYIVAEFAVKMESYKLAEHYKGVEEATRLRDALLTGMNKAAESPLLRGVSIDSNALSAMLRDHLLRDYEGIEEVLFVSLFKQDVPRL